MKNIEDLKNVWIELQKKYKWITFKIKEKPYPESIIQWAKIVDSMWLFIKYKNILFTSWRLNSQCDDRIFDLHIEDLKTQLDEIILWIVNKKEYDFLF